MSSVSSMGGPTEFQWDRMRYPTLSAFFEGAPAAEFWRHANELILDRLEEIVATVIEKEPLRFKRKIGEFGRQADEELPLDFRFELLVAARLLEAEICFEFGADGQPDLHCTIPSTSDRIWVEATTRSKNDIKRLYQEIENSQLDVVGRVEIRAAERRLSISAKERNAIRERICESLSCLETNSSVTVQLPELPGSAFCERLLEGESLMVTLGTLPISDQYIAEVEREFFNVLRKKDKVRQAVIGPTLLIVDVSRLGLAWARAEDVWGVIIPRLDIPWGELPYVGVAITLTGLTSFTVRGYHFLRPGISALNCETALRVLDALGTVRVLSGEECIRDNGST